MRTIIVLLLACTMVGACSRTSHVQYYRGEPRDTGKRQSGPAMLFYEQAEADLDVHNVVVTPPAGEKVHTTANEDR